MACRYLSTYTPRSQGPSPEILRGKPIQSRSLPCPMPASRTNIRDRQPVQFVLARRYGAARSGRRAVAEPFQSCSILSCRAVCTHHTQPIQKLLIGQVIRNGARHSSWLLGGYRLGSALTRPIYLSPTQKHTIYRGPFIANALHQNYTGRAGQGRHSGTLPTLQIDTRVKP